MKGEDLMKLDLINGKPGRSMFLFALPMIIGNLFQQFYNMADSVIVGNLVGEEALAAVGASYSFTTVFIMVAIGSGMGASVLASQYLGAKKYREMKTSIYTFLIAFGMFSVLMALLGFFVNPAILRALKTPDNIFADAVLYLQIYFAGLPFMFMYSILSANFNALGKSQIPLILLIFSSVLNVVLDLWMVAGLRLGVAGVAIATVIAQGVSSVISFVILMRLLKEYETEGAVKKFDSGMFAGGVRIAVPSIIQQSIVSIGMLLTQSAVNQFGSSAVAGYSAGMRLESVCVVPMIASGNAMSTFTAQNLGAGTSGGRLPRRVPHCDRLRRRADPDLPVFLRAHHFHVCQCGRIPGGIFYRDGLSEVYGMVLCLSRLQVGDRRSPAGGGGCEGLYDRESDQSGNPCIGGAALLPGIWDSVCLVCGAVGVVCEFCHLVPVVPDGELEGEKAH